MKLAEPGLPHSSATCVPIDIVSFHRHLLDLAEADKSVSKQGRTYMFRFNTRSIGDLIPPNVVM